jgi:hypothetical protein
MSPVGPKGLDPDRLGEAAGGWGQTIAAVTTAAGIFAVFGAETKIEELTDAARGQLLLALGLAFVCGLVAIVLAFLAQFDDGSGYGPIKQNHMLYVSIGAAVIGAILIARAPLIVFDGKKTDDTPVAYFVTYGSDKTAVCGDLVRNENGNLSLNGEALTGVESIAKAEDGCPAVQAGALVTPAAGGSVAATPES